MQFKYYYGAEADQFNFIRVPKAMMKDAAFASLSHASKLLYGLLLDRMSLSMKNRWFDDQNRVYIIYQITEIMDDLNITKKKAIGYLQELEEFGLVEKKRRGLGLPSYLYVKSFIIDRDYSVTEEVREKELLRGAETDTSRGAESGTLRSGETDTFRSFDLVTSKSVTEEPQEVHVKAPQNNNDKSNIKENNTNLFESGQSNLIVEQMDEYKVYDEYLYDKIEPDVLYERNPEDKEIISGMYDLILETLLSKKTTICVAGSEFPAQVVKSRLMKIDSSHIEYVLSCLKSNTTKVKNIKSYLLTAIFNAPTTIHGYYQAEFNHDMPEYVKGKT